MRSKWIFRCFRPLFLAFVAFALNANTVFPQNQTHEIPESCLWKVRSAVNSGNCVYLLGSIHLLKPENYPLKSSLSDAFDNVQALFFEIHPDSAETPAAQMQFMARGLFADGKTLHKSLTEKTYAEAKKIAASVGLSIETMEKFKPWFFSLTVMTMKLAQLGFRPEYGIDRWFFNKAKQAHKKVYALETVAFQIDLFDKVASTHSDEFVAQTFDEFEIIASEIDTLVAAWQNGRIGQLEQILLRNFKDYPPIYQAFLVQRNKNWLPQIEALFGQKDNFMVIVGCGHLIGDDGLIKILQDSGYLIQQL